jgi:predicted dehydrogenase
MIKMGLVGVGKMGISHLAILGAHPQVDVVAICDSATYITSVLRKHSGVTTYKDFGKMLNECKLDGLFIATPTSSHFDLAKTALEKGLHLFVEKPLCLNAEQSEQLAKLAVEKHCVNQVGYHNRFIGTFREMRRLVQAGAIGDVYHVDGRAFGQVVIRPKSGSTWRSKKTEGGGCLHDYACHVLDLMNFVAGPPDDVVSAQLQSIFSTDIEDAVFASFRYPTGATGYLETNWSDESYRKMSTTITVYGTKGKLIADRQELRVYLRSGAEYEQYPAGWTIRYITDLQSPVGYYLRGEEYSAQIDSFVEAIQAGNFKPENSFASAAQTDNIIDQIARMGKSS